MTAFSLPKNRAAKADPALIARDEEQLDRVDRCLTAEMAQVAVRLREALSENESNAQMRLERDFAVHRLSARLKMLGRYGLDLCLGRMVPQDGGDPIYIGRIGLADAGGERVLVDWRSPAAAPFFSATLANPEGLRSKRRYRWTNGMITDYWDEVFDRDAADSAAALDDQSAFIATLGAHRSPQMRDVLGTIASDQDAIIRAGSPGTLVVDGGPGTGKTVVALHRAAYLMYADPLLNNRRGGVLFIGPSAPYLAYVDDVLPSLGEEGVRVATLADLVPEGATARTEDDPEVRALKSSGTLVRAVLRAVRLHEQPPTRPLVVETEWADLEITEQDWEEAFESAEPGTPHNEARDEVWESLVRVLHARVEDDDADLALVRRSLARHSQLARIFTAAWPLLDAADLIADLLSDPMALAEATPDLSVDERALLIRADSRAWTDADLPLLDAARMRLGDPNFSRVTRAEESSLEQDEQYRNDMIDYLIGADDDFDGAITMLWGEDSAALREKLVDRSGAAQIPRDALAGPFSHVIVDEAQELTDAQWQMLVRRCPSRSFTVVGDRAQARLGFTESWAERLQRVGLRNAREAALTINYRTPAEVMAAAEPAIRTAIPDANVPTSIRASGIPVRMAPPADRDAVIDGWLADHPAGTACVIGDSTFAATDRVLSLTPEAAKGLEFDLVVLMRPADFGLGITGAVDRYVAMTRTTQQLVILG